MGFCNANKIIHKEQSCGEEKRTSYGLSRWKFERQCGWRINSGSRRDVCISPCLLRLLIFLKQVPSHNLLSLCCLISSMISGWIFSRSSLQEHGMNTNTSWGLITPHPAGSVQTTLLGISLHLHVFELNVLLIARIMQIKFSFTCVDTQRRLAQKGWSVESCAVLLFIYACTCQCCSECQAHSTSQHK